LQRDVDLAAGRGRIADVLQHVVGQRGCADQHQAKARGSVAQGSNQPLAPAAQFRCAHRAIPQSFIVFKGDLRLAFQPATRPIRNQFDHLDAVLVTAVMRPSFWPKYIPGLTR
jgi:hypothetical protein